MSGSIPLFGRARFRVYDVVNVSIHGDMYFDLIVRIISAEGEAELSSDELGEGIEDDEVRIGEWSIRQPSYQVRVPGHLFSDREPCAGDRVDIMFIAQQASELEFLD